MAETVLLQSPRDLSILNLTFIEKAIVGILKNSTSGSFLPLSIGEPQPFQAYL